MYIEKNCKYMAFNKDVRQKHICKYMAFTKDVH